MDLQQIHALCIRLRLAPLKQSSERTGPIRHRNRLFSGLSRPFLSAIVWAMKTLEAARAARNFRNFLREVHLRQESFKIVEEGVTFAYLLPASEGACDSHGF